MSRKVMTRMVLANWGVFQQPEIVRFGEDTSCFVGINGAGKSMSLDAMQYTLFGITEFNVAASQNQTATQVKKSRTVSDMIHGNKKAEGDGGHILRPEPTIFYCIIEFYDEQSGENFICGNLTESAGCLEKPKGYWFVSPSTSIEDFTFRSDDGTTLYAKNECLLKGRPVPPGFYMNKELGMRQISRAIGIERNATDIKNAIKKIVAFDPEADVNKFIANSVLDEGTGTKESVLALKNITEGYNKAEAELEALKDKTQKLQTADEKAKEYEEATKDYKLNRLRVAKNDVFTHANAIRENNRKLEEENKNLRDLAEKREDITGKLSDARRDKNRIEQSDKMQAYSNARSAKEREIRQCRFDMEASGKRLSDLKQFQKAAKEAVSLCDDGSVEHANISEWLYHVGQDGRPNLYSLLELFLKKKNDEAYSTKIRCETERVQLGEEIRELNKELSGLRVNTLKYPAIYEEAKKALERHFKKKGLDVRIRLFAECINEVKAPEWQPAIESYLGDRRFQIIVPARYEDEAFGVIRELGLHRTDIPIFEVFKTRKREILEGSVASLLDITNYEAKLFAAHICGNVMLADSEEEVKEFAINGKRSITIDGTSSSGYSRRFNDLSGKMYIGEAARISRMKQIEKKLLQKQNEAAENGKKLKNCQEVIDKIGLVIFETGRYDFDVEKKYNELVENLHHLEAQLEEYDEQNSELQKILEDADKAIDNLEMQLSECDRGIGGAQTKIATVREAITEAEKRREEAEREYEAYAAMDPDYEFDVEEEFEDAMRKGIMFKAPSKKKLEEMKDNMIRKEAAMTAAQQDYRHMESVSTNDSSIESTTGPQFIEEFRRLLHELDGVEIEKATEEVRKQEEKMRASLLKDVVARIGEQIDKASRTAQNLNRELRKHWFGQHQYEFEISHRKDKEEYFSILSAYRTHKDDTRNDYIDYDPNLREKVSLFQEKILLDIDSTEYTNYKNYIVCDLLIHDKAGQTYRMSRGGSSFSNGEKQTPYLIIMVACLNRLYPENRSVAKLCFIDEAFAAYSGERVAEMMLFLKENNIQAVFAAPDKSFNSLAQYMQAVITCAKPDGSSYSHYVDGINSKGVDHAA